ncbi:hypothetical protein PVAP13_1NG239338 [Panicum virgatum]|uniref:Uncharacterized protein n=1 Tax=Panicum virgatum TaxID=38727 RepID=A0A8T0WU93_PANVG|nr:hypothetical protein PVAP13_1NG239338 [Panicum virgatum]
MHASAYGTDRRGEPALAFRMDSSAPVQRRRITDPFSFLALWSGGGRRPNDDVNRHEQLVHPIRSDPILYGVLAQLAAASPRHPRLVCPRLPLRGSVASRGRRRRRPRGGLARPPDARKLRTHDDLRDLREGGRRHHKMADAFAPAAQPLPTFVFWNRT